ncbi:MAG: hypothetical protein CML42_09510 [Rhodobacteraceae bacterium]|nr:hypothetical protein [Paracoccaceae bacterium]|tara:strand:+ start:4227 stop:4793 length:567 start_codon:yes stop_codon:yes gene_type:complete
MGNGNKLYMYYLYMEITYVKGLFLLFLIVSGNFIGNTLGCQIQHLFTYSMKVKEILIFLLIYFTLNIVDNKSLSPFEHMKISFKIWILYMLLTRMNVTFSIMVFSLLAIIYVLQQQVDFKKEHDDLTKEEEEKYNKIMSILEKLAMSLSVVGFVSYLIAKKHEYKGKFTLYKFILGKRECRGINHLKY